MSTFIEYYAKKQQKILRGVTQDLRDARIRVDTKEAVGDAVDFFRRKNDFDRVKAANKARFATIIEKQENAASNTEVSAFDYYKVGVRDGEVVKYDIGMYPTICTGIGQCIAKTTACQFTSPEQSYKYMNGTTQSSDVAELISMHRSTGGYNTAIVGSDFLASSVNVGIVHVFPKGEWLAYECVSPSDVHLVFDDVVIETLGNGREIERSTDYCDIEDAAAVIIRRGSADTIEKSANPNESIWIAYIGARNQWKLGRMVTYRGADYWPIPLPDEKDRIITEYTHNSDGICNPMTHVAKKGKKGVGGGFEYPIAAVIGDMDYIGSSALPTVLSLYENVVELESQWSHLLHNADKCASGTKWVMLGTDTQLPRSLDIVVLRNGQQFGITAPPSSGVDSQLEVVTAATRGVGAGYNVPPYIVIGAAPSAPESGISLAIRTRPLIDGRDRRIDMNRGSVEKIFNIEQALLFEIDPKFESFFAGTKQVWNPGTWVPPQDDSTRTDDIVKRRDAGFIDQYQAIVEANRLPSIQDAKDLDKEYSKRDADYISADQKIRDKKNANKPNPVPPVSVNQGTVQDQDQEEPRTEAPNE